MENSAFSVQWCCLEYCSPPIVKLNIACSLVCTALIGAWGYQVCHRDAVVELVFNHPLLRYIVTYCTRYLTFLVDNAQQNLNAFSCLPAHLCIIIPRRKKTLELQSEFESRIWGMDKVVIVASRRDGGELNQMAPLGNLFCSSGT